MRSIKLRFARSSLAAALGAASLAIPTPALACTLCSCSVSTTGISFGVYNPTTSAPTETSGTISINCTGVLSLFGSVDVAANPGSSGTSAQRTMTQGTSLLTYNLFTDSARTLVFGDGTGGTSTMSAPLNGLLAFSQSLPVYARIPAKQWTRAGPYSDSIVITVTY